MDENRIAMNWPLLLAAFAVISAVLSIKLLLHADTVPLFGDTDDAMRMVVVRDFLNGQNWYDLVQHRLNTPFGAEIHWSRLIDAPLAGLVLLGRFVAGEHGDAFAAVVWPLILLFILLVLSARLCLRLVGRDGMLPGVVLPAFSPPIMAEFTPGRIDHHNVQIILTLVIVSLTVEALRRPRFAIGVGIAAATALAIGTEALPTVLAATIAFGLFWVITPKRGAAMRAFGLSFAGAAFVQLALAAPVSQWLAPACDALSITYVAGAFGVGLAFTLLPLLPLASKPMPVRLAVGLATGGLLIVILLILFPQCRGGPYAAVDPWLVANWLDQIVEARPAWESLFALPAYTAAALLPILAALLTIGAILWRGPARRDDGAWAILGLFLLLAFIVATVEIRGARIAGIIAVPVGAWLIVAARRHYLAHRRILPAAALVGAWLLFAGIAISTIIAGVNLLAPRSGGAMAGEPAPNRQACLLPQAFTELAALPPSRMMAPVDLGSHILLHTAHSVVGAPYHRNEDGVIDTFRFFNGPPAEARAILAKRGIAYVVTCPNLPEMRNGLPDKAPDSFIALAQNGETPDWLTEISPAGATLRIFAIGSMP
jgi:hypothetical protein